MGLDLIHISLHGLIRGDHMELGRDPDTGGQCLYVLELVKALALDPEVDRVSLLTRRVADPKLSADYAREHEPLGPKAEIVRIDAGPKRYLRKEVLWRHLDAFIDSTLSYLRKQRRVPDLIHAHYADAGYVGRHLAAVLGCPFIFTGHSLGRVKLQRLQHGGADLAEMEERYNLAARIEAEELSLDAANLVCTSTRQEVEEQYSIYHQYAESRMRVIPPGVDLSRFEGECAPELMASVEGKLGAFLTDSSRVPILTIARADERKNLPALVRAFSKNRWLRENANLIVIGGNRDSFAKLPNGPKRVWNELLRAIDDADLYGRIAYPKRHEPAEIPAFYQWVEERGGVFVNPAFTEPFGLTLLEAAAGGLPLVATNDGGPRDILANCANGVLIDPMDELEMGTAIEEIAADPQRRSQLSANGSTNVRRHYSWSRHVERYLSEVGEIVASSRTSRPTGYRKKSFSCDRWIVMDLVPSLQTEAPGLIQRWRDLLNDPRIGLGIATGLPHTKVMEMLAELEAPDPAFIISSLGAELYFGGEGTPDARWSKQVANRWEIGKVREIMEEIPGLVMQPQGEQHPFKVSYLMDPSEAPGRMSIQSKLRQAGVAAKVIVTARAFIDVVPIRSGKDVALRYVEHRWGIPPENIFYFGRNGNDVAAVRGRNVSTIPADADRVLRQLSSRPRIYHARNNGLEGFFEGLEHYQFLDPDRPPRPAEEDPGIGDAIPRVELHP